jgi:hypothetical protein
VIGGIITSYVQAVWTLTYLRITHPAETTDLEDTGKETVILSQEETGKETVILSREELDDADET